MNCNLWPEALKFVKREEIRYHIDIEKGTSKSMTWHTELTSDAALTPGLQHLSINIGLQRSSTECPRLLRIVERILSALLWTDR